MQENRAHIAGGARLVVSARGRRCDNKTAKELVRLAEAQLEEPPRRVAAQGRTTTTCDLGDGSRSGQSRYLRHRRVAGGC